MAEDPFIALGQLQQRTIGELKKHGLHLERMVAEASDSGPRFMQLVVTALPDWSPSEAPDDQFDELVMGARRAEQQRRAEAARSDLEEIARDLSGDEGGPDN